MRDDINPRPLLRFAHRAKYIRVRSSVLPDGQNIAPEGYIAPRKRYIANPGRDLYRCGVFSFEIHRKGRFLRQLVVVGDHAEEGTE